MKQKSAAKQLVPVCSSWVDGVYAYSYHVRRSSRCDICETKEAVQLGAPVNQLGSAMVS